METTLCASMRLQPYERHVACVLVAVFLALCIGGLEKPSTHFQDEIPCVLVKIVGAAKAEEIRIPLGATVDEVLRKAEVFHDAELSECDGTKKVQNQEIIVVPFKGKQTFFVCGAVKNPKVIVLDSEVSAQKILEKVEVDETANVKAFLRRKIFRNGSVIEVKKLRARTKK